jgi:phosphate butyryltransferase
MPLKDLSFLFDVSRYTRPKNVVIALPYASDSIIAAARARELGIANPILVGDPEKIKNASEGTGVDVSNFDSMVEPDHQRAIDRSVQAVSSGDGDVLMKGMVKTADLLKAVLNREWGLRTDRLLSHVMLYEVPSLGRVFGISDAGMNINPDLNAKKQIIENGVDLFWFLGVKVPRVALLAAVETVNPDMQCTLDAAALTAMNRRGQISGCLVDGPLALDNALYEECAREKGIHSEVAGKADLLVVPDIHAGNMLSKSILFIMKATGAALMMGARKPVVITSRYGNPETKVYSMAMGAYAASFMK